MNPVFKLKKLSLTISIALLLLACTGKTIAQNNSNNAPLFSFSDDKGKYGYKDKAGKTIVPAMYDAAGYFSEGLAVVMLNNKSAYIDNTGKIVIPWLPYYDAVAFQEGLAVVRNWDEKAGFKFGYINKQGKEVIPLIYDLANDFYEGIAYVEKDGKRLAITNTGSIAFERQKDIGYWQCSDGLIRIVKNNRYGFADKKGNIVIQPKYFFASHFIDGLSAVGDSLHRGVINKKEETVVPFIFDYITIQKNYPILLIMKDRAGFADKTRKMIMPMVFEKGYLYGNQLAAAERDLISYTIITENGIIKARQVRRNAKGEPIPEETSKSTNDVQDGYFVPSYPLFSENLAPVVKNGLIGYINKQRKLIIPFQYKYAESFSNGLAAVSDGKKWGFIDEAGKLVIEMKYDKVLRFQAGITGVWIGEKYLTIKKDGSLYE